MKISKNKNLSSKKEKLLNVNNSKNWQFLTRSINYQPKICLSIEIHRILMKKAQENDRTLNNEIITRLIKTLDQ